MAVAPSSTLFDKVIEFLASMPDSGVILAFKPSPMLEQRLTVLLEQNRRDFLTADERAELDEFLRMNHLINLLTIRVRQNLSRFSSLVQPQD
jgi:hypothetical protein